MCLGNTLSENPWVFTVEKQVDPRKLAVVALLVPVASVNFPIGVVAVDENRSPLSGAIFVAEETLATDWSEISISIVSETDPFFREATVILCIVKWL